MHRPLQKNTTKSSCPFSGLQKNKSPAVHNTSELVSALAMFSHFRSFPLRKYIWVLGGAKVHVSRLCGLQDHKFQLPLPLDCSVYFSLQRIRRRVWKQSKVAETSLGKSQDVWQLGCVAQVCPGTEAARISEGGPPVGHLGFTMGAGSHVGFMATVIHLGFYHGSCHPSWILPWELSAILDLPWVALSNKKACLFRVLQVKFELGWTEKDEEGEEDSSAEAVGLGALCHPLCQCRKCHPLQKVRITASGHVAFQLPVGGWATQAPENLDQSELGVKVRVDV